jgi:hypothetical protein
MKKIPQYEIYEEIQYNIGNPEKSSILKAMKVISHSTKHLKRSYKKKKG